MRYYQEKVGCICQKIYELGLKQGTIIRCYLSGSTWIVLCLDQVDLDTGYLTGLDQNGKCMTVYCKSIKSFEICECPEEYKS